MAERVKFPRETRIAVDQHLGEQRTRVPLSRFTKIHEHSYRPAIPHKESANEDSYFEGMIEYYFSPRLQDAIIF